MTCNRNSCTIKSLAMNQSLQNVFESLSAPYLFVGSGFSRRYCGAPSWQELLIRLAKETRPDKEYPFASYKSEEEDGEPSIIYPRIASKIEREYNRLFFEGGIEKGQEHAQVDYEKSGESPFRRHLAHIFSEISKTSLPPDLEEELSDLGVIAKHSVNGVITTNYDGFLENVFPDYDVYIGQEDLIFSQSTGVAEVYKIHGCYTNPRSLVFTDGDYAGFEKRKAYLTAKLLSIFMENPVIFFGYSANDSDILGIFESIANCLSADHLMQLGKRIIFVDYSEETHGTTIATGFMHLNGKNMSYTHILTNSYLPIFKRLLKVKRNYDPRILRRLKKDVYSTITTNDAVDVVKVISDGDFFDANYQFKHNALVGLSVSDHGGHNVLTSEDVYRNVIRQDGGIEIKSFVESWLVGKMTTNEYPVFFYVRQYLEKYPNATLPENIIEYMNNHSTFDSFLNKNIRRGKKNRQHSTISQLKEEWENLKNRYTKVMYLDEAELNERKLLEFLQEHMEECPDCLQPGAEYATDLRRLIRICDYLENATAVLGGENGGKRSFCAVGTTEHHDKDSSIRRTNPMGAPSEGIIA